MEDKIIYPEVSFTEEWKEGRRFEREKILKLIDEDIKNQESQLKGDFHRDSSIKWRVCGLKLLKRKLEVPISKQGGKK